MDRRLKYVSPSGKHGPSGKLIQSSFSDCLLLCSHARLPASIYRHSPAPSLPLTSLPPFDPATLLMR